MRAELAESKASGEVAAIYAEVRRLCAVPYVSSLQRHLATHGIAHGQAGNNVSVLPNGVGVLLVREKTWPKVDCESASRRWLARCL